MLNRVALDQVPMGAPCWVPGLSPRILFVSGDGKPYRYEFKEADGGLFEEDEEARPRPLTWRGTPPGRGNIFFLDLIWPTAPELKGRLIATLYIQGQRDGMEEFLGPQLWWIALGADGMTIERAGRLIVPDLDRHGDDPDREERFPRVTPTPEGGLALAYLTRSSHRSSWLLNVAPIEIDPASGEPTVQPGRVRCLAEGCAPASPTFSIDGRWIYGHLTRESHGRADRHAEILGRRRPGIRGPWPIGSPVATASGRALPAPHPRRSRHLHRVPACGGAGSWAC